MVVQIDLKFLRCTKTSTKGFLFVESADETLQCFPVVPFVIMCKVVETFESVDEILKEGHSD